MIWVFLYLRPYNPDRAPRTRRASLAGLKHRSTHSFAQVAFPLRHKHLLGNVLISSSSLHVSASLSSAALISSRDQLSDVLPSHLQSAETRGSDIMMSMNTNIEYV